MEPARTSPFHDFRLSRGVTWLEPTLSVELTYSEIMEAGSAIRFIGSLSNLARLSHVSRFESEEPEGPQPGHGLRYAAQRTGKYPDHDMPGCHEFPSGLEHVFAVNVEPDTRTRHAEPAAWNGLELGEQGRSTLGMHSATLRSKISARRRGLS